MCDHGLPGAASFTYLWALPGYMNQHLCILFDIRTWLVWDVSLYTCDHTFELVQMKSTQVFLQYNRFSVWSCGFVVNCDGCLIASEDQSPNKLQFSLTLFVFNFLRKKEKRKRSEQRRRSDLLRRRPNCNWRYVSAKSIQGADADEDSSGQKHEFGGLSSSRMVGSHKGSL